MSAYDLVIRGGTVVSPTGRTLSDVGITDGRINLVGSIPAGSGGEEIDARGLCLLPGPIDTQVHFREPGGMHKEDLESGTRAAALGGITGIFEMPNTNPPTTTRAALEDKLARALGRAHVDHAFYAGASPENVDDLAEIERTPGCCGIKVFMGSSTGSLLVEDDETLLRVLKSGRRRVAFHSEDEPRLRQRRLEIPAGADASWHPIWRDVECALTSTRRLLDLVDQAQRPAHVLHVTTAEEAALLRERKGDLVTVETTPQHLTLFAPDCYERLGTYAQMNPPIRDIRHREALWEAVRDGTVDVIGSDHAPHSREEKDAGYPNTPSGMPGVQTLLPMMLDHVAEGRLTLERVVELTNATPARIFRIAGKGGITPGLDADITLVDLEHRRTITDDWIASLCGWTPFAGHEVRGWPIATIIRGRIVMRDDEIVTPHAGLPMAFDLD